LHDWPGRANALVTDRWVIVSIASAYFAGTGVSDPLSGNIYGSLGLSRGAPLRICLSCISAATCRGSHVERTCHWILYLHQDVIDSEALNLIHWILKWKRKRSRGWPVDAPKLWALPDITLMSYSSASSRKGPRSHSVPSKSTMTMAAVLSAMERCIDSSDKSHDLESTSANTGLKPSAITASTVASTVV
jgi:hypothetical protein